MNANMAVNTRLWQLRHAESWQRAKTEGGAAEKVPNVSVSSTHWDEGFQGRAQRIPTRPAWRGTSGLVGNRFVGSEFSGLS
jgi:hypothetical protein